MLKKIFLASICLMLLVTVINCRSTLSVSGGLCRNTTSFSCPTQRKIPLHVRRLEGRQTAVVASRRTGRRPLLRVMTLNVNYGAVNPALTIRRIRDSKAGIVALQEVTWEWRRALEGSLKKEFPTMLFRHTMGGDLAFLSRYPMRSLKQMKPPTGGWFPGWLVEAKTPLGRIQLLNLHLRPPLSAKKGWLSMASAYLFKTPPIRLRELKSYLKQAKVFQKGKTKPMLLVLGDFNENEKGSGVRWLQTEHKMKSALAQHDSSTPTWHWLTRSLPVKVTLRDRLDHIMHPPKLRCIHAQVLPDAASDHFPVLAFFVKALKP